MSTRASCFVMGLLFFAQAFGSAQALAGGGKRITPEQVRSTCDELAAKGFTEKRTVDWTKITRDQGKLDLVMPVNFQAYNEKGDFFHMNFDEGDVNRYLEQLRDVYHGCGIEVELHSLRYPEGPRFLDDLARNSGEASELSDRERCLFRPLHVDNEVNVYFVQVVSSVHEIGRSHAWLNAYLTPAEPGDTRYIGAVVVTDFDRSSFSHSAPFVVPHEVGHVIFDMGHVSEYNLMADSAEKLSYYVTADQCERARRSPLIRSRSQLDYAFKATGKVYRRGD